jgi:hypothetical protein
VFYSARLVVWATTLAVLEVNGENFRAAGASRDKCMSMTESSKDARVDSFSGQLVAMLIADVPSFSDHIDKLHHKFGAVEGHAYCYSPATRSRPRHVDLADHLHLL